MVRENSIKIASFTRNLSALCDGADGRCRGPRVRRGPGGLCAACACARLVSLSDAVSAGRSETVPASSRGGAGARQRQRAATADDAAAAC